MIKLSKFAKDVGVTKVTVYNWKTKGLLDFVKSETGRNFISIETYNKFLGIKEDKEQKVIIYCRVSSSVNKKNLETQKERLISYCFAKGYKIHKIVEEFGSGLNDKRPKLEKILKDRDFTKIVIEHKDSLCRHGFNYIDTLLGKNVIEVINNSENDKQDLV
jgi:putative resolvase